MDDLSLNVRLIIRQNVSIPKFAHEPIELVLGKRCKRFFQVAQIPTSLALTQESDSGTDTISTRKDDFVRAVSAPRPSRYLVVGPSVHLVSARSLPYLFRQCGRPVWSISPCGSY